MWLYAVENDPALWPLGWSKWPLSKVALRAYLAEQSGNLFQDGQLRLAYCSKEGLAQPLGMVDLFDFDPNALKAGLGLAVVAERRNEGHGKRMLEMMLHYCRGVLNLNSLYAHIPSENVGSRKVFEQQEFEVVGTLRQWVQRNKVFEDAILVQKIL